MSGFNLKFPSQPRRQAMSNTERQRRFRKRHPGYYASLKATRRAMLAQGSGQTMAAFAERLRADAKAASGQTREASEAGSVAIECGMI